ncbi:hypothetical protein HID58_087567 [Brassica napus]|uniref:BnaC09g29370D protein n=2 Tax=Brassica napus TaxID=3708 RepID=A0A078G2Y9_BRANA|nr:hypothetical protein HID58_090041 [Brassica napus]KAH0859306.1 hypothetical protein HID58_087567 [Brassica napus]CAF1756466.1 unnamed protein product [Brassica napus]CDY19681.1 BnaC09g29370D [Brassica napus]
MVPVRPFHLHMLKDGPAITGFALSKTWRDQKIDHEVEFLVIAADGLWDVVPNEDAVSLPQSEEEPEAVARKLTFTASTRGSADSITCIVVKFRQPEPKSNHNAETGTESSPKAETELILDATPDQK